MKMFSCSDDADMTDEIPQMFAEAGVSPSQARSQARRRLPSMASSAHSDTDFGDTGEP